jgi:hypothetical protein
LPCASVAFVVLLVLLVIIGCQVYWVFPHLTTHVIFQTLNGLPHQQSLHRRAELHTVCCSADGRSKARGKSNLLDEWVTPIRLQPRQGRNLCRITRSKFVRAP